MKKIILILGLAFCFLTGFTQQKGTFKDIRDGKIYKTVKIGDQTWFAENLAYKPQNGNYWAYNNEQINVAKYGYLYDWETANKVCPNGWHLPNQYEWKLLISNVSDNEIIAATKLEANSGWLSEQHKGTNESSFNILPGGYHLNDGRNGEIGYHGFFWTSTKDNSINSPSYFMIDFYSTALYFYSVDSGNAYSVRCIKN